MSRRTLVAQAQTGHEKRASKVMSLGPRTTSWSLSARAAAHARVVWTVASESLSEPPVSCLSLRSSPFFARLMVLE